MEKIDKTELIRDLLVCKGAPADIDAVYYNKESNIKITYKTIDGKWVGTEETWKP